MKRILGVLSLIAILTVAFTSQASANDIGNEVVYIGQSYDQTIVVRHFADAGIEIEFDSNGFINVADSSVNYIASGEDVEIPDIVSRDLYYTIFKTETINTWKDLPFEVGWTNEKTTLYKFKNSIVVWKDLPFEVGRCN